MKIMIVLSRLQGGGAERVATIWANSFAQAGHEVAFASNVTHADGPPVYPISEEVRLIKCFGFHSQPPAGWKAFVSKHFPFIYKVARRVSINSDVHSRLHKAIRDFRPDVIIGVAQPASTQALFASRGLPCRVIATEHNPFERPECAPLSRRQRFFKFVANKWFDAVTLLTETDRVYVGDRLKNVRVMPNPLALPPIAENVPKEKRIVAAGRLDVWFFKGFDLLIRAWGGIADKYPGWTVEIAGEPLSKASETMAALNRLIDENGVRDRCVLSGFHSDMADFFKKSEIFVLPSRYEGFGMVLIEAMSQGCACIACDFKGRQSEIIRDETEGMCIPTEDEGAIVKALERMINDREYRQTVQKNAPKRAADFSPEIIERRWESLFDSLE